MHFFFSTKPHNCPHPNSTLYTLSKERVGRLKHFSISCMLPQTRSTARCVAASVKTSTLYSKNNFLPFYILQTLQCGPSMTFWVEQISRGQISISTVQCGPSMRFYGDNNLIDGPHCIYPQFLRYLKFIFSKKASKIDKLSQSI